MQIRIMAFGIAKEILGDRQLSMEVPDACSVAELKNQLIHIYPDFEKLRSLSLAVNQDYVRDDVILFERDEIVIIPPVSGG